MSTFGDLTDRASQNAGFSRYALVCWFTLADNNATVSKLSARISNSTPACNVKGLIYSDTGGHYPKDLLALGSNVSVGASLGVGWVDLPFSSPPTLQAGDYHLGLVADASATGFSMYYGVGSLSQSHSAAAQNFASPDNPFAVGQPPLTEVYAIYATYTTGGFSVATTAITDIASTTATCGGTITGLTAAITAKGVCWNTGGAPTIADSHTTQ